MAGSGRKRRAVARAEIDLDKKPGLGSQADLTPNGRPQPAEYARRLIEASLDPLVTISPDGKITDVNEATIKATGVPRVSLIGTDFSNYFTEPEKARAGYRRVFREGLVRDYPLELRRHDGAVTSVLYNASVYRDQSGNVAGVFAAARDITERKRAEEEVRRLNVELERRVAERTAQLQETNDAVLREKAQRSLAQEALHASDERFRVMFEHAPVGIALGDLQGHLVETNPAFADLLGYGKAELAGMSLADLTHPDDLAAEQPLMQELLAGTRQCYDIEKRYRRKDGQVVWVRIAGSVLRNHRGEPEYGLAVVQDISQRKRAEAALRGSEARFRSMFTSNVVPLALWDVHGRLLDANDLFLELIGYSREQFEAKQVRWDEATPPDMRQRDRDAVKELQAGRDIAPYEKQFVRPDGTRVWVLVGGRMLPDMVDTGIVFAVDITERKLGEAALRESEERLRAAIAGSRGAEWQIPADQEQEHGFGDAASLSPQVKGFVGFAADEFPNSVSAWRQRIHPDDLPAITTAARAHIEKRTPFYNAEYRIRHKDGSWRHLLTTGRLQRDSDGRPLRWIGLDWDITERKQALDELRRLAQFPAENPTPVLRIASDGALLYANAPAQRWLAALDWEVGRPLPAAVLSVVTDACAQPLAVQAEISGGAERTLWISAMRPPGEDYVNLYGRDITERKRSEEALCESEHRERERAEELAALLDAVPTPVVIAHDPECTHMIGNRAANQLLRLPSGGEISLTGPLERRPHHYKAVKEGRELKVDELPVRRAAKGEHVQGFEYTLVFDDGTTRELVAYGTPLRDGQGNPRGAVHTLVDITERKRAEEALRESEERFRGIVETAEEGIATHELDGTVNYVNQRMADMLGYSRGEMIGRSSLEFVDDEDKEVVRRARESLRERGSFSQERELRRRDRTILWTLCNVSLRRNGAGKHCGYLAMHTDITQRKHAEETLRAKEAQLELIADATPVLLTRISRDLRYLFVNHACAEMFGRPPEEIVGKPVVEIIGQEALETIRPHFERVLQGERVEYETEIPYRGAGLRSMHVTYIPERGGRGEVIGWLASIQDITEHKQAQDELRQSEQRVREHAARLQAVLDSAPALIWISHDRECRSMTGNRGAFEFSRVPIGQDLSKTGSAAERLAHYRVFENGRELAPREMPMQRVAASGQAIMDCAVEFHFDDGTVRSLLGNVVPTLDAHGQPDGAIAAFMDITELRQLQSEREALLSSERAARAEAEHASRMKDEFIATLSHELRNPLNAILGWAQLLRRPHRSADDVAQGVQVIENSGRMLADMVTDLLDVSRIVGGKLRLDVQTAELHPIIAAAVETVRSAADAKRVALVTMCDKQIGCVRADPNRLQQVIWNLLSNAVKFTEPGGSVCAIASRTASAMEIMVCDTGQGIAPEFLPHMFERFRQEDGSMSRKHGGLGLGLSIVRSLVELHGGTIRAESEGKGKGATFTVTLPAPAVSGEGEQPGNKLIGPSEPLTLDWTNTTLDGIKVVLVDDEPEALGMIKRVLEERFAQVFTATCAREGMELLQRIRPDVLISDIGMPEEDGFQFMRHVRTLDPQCGGATPAVALTAYAGLDDRQRAMVCGYQAHLPKPVEVNRLVATVASLAGRVAFTPDVPASEGQTVPAE